ncbi:MAG: YgiT-type zinc finger protein [Caldilineaceae bacterium]
MTQQTDDPYTCGTCGTPDARIRYVTRSYGHGDSMLVIEKIPMIVCRACGESYFTADTAFELERIKAHQTERAVVHYAPVVQFTA